MAGAGVRIDRDRHVLIGGPTASGKSALALAIAARDGGVVVNADALQVWSCWRVLTARPSAADGAAAPHALYGHVAPGEAYSVGHWLREVAGLLDGGQRLVIVGGTGLFLTALTEGLAEIPAVDPAWRAEADARLAAGGGLAGLLAELDPATRARIDTANPARVQRAWEVWRGTGRGLADWQAETGPPLLVPEAAVRLVVDPDRDVLAGRIAARFDAMLAAGAMDEVCAADAAWVVGAPWTRAIGAAELRAVLHGAPLSAAREAAVVATRQYAKRQRSWFRNRMPDWPRWAG